MYIQPECSLKDAVVALIIHLLYVYIQLFVDAETVTVEDGDTEDSDVKEVELKIRARYEKAFDQVSITPDMVKVKILVLE